MRELTRVEIVIPVHNRREITLQCLKSLSRVNTDGIELHIIMVDDGSTDGTMQAVREHFPKVQMIRGSGDLFFTAATNLGIKAALDRDPDFILTMNDDAVFDSEFLISLVNTARANPRSVIGGLLLLWDQPHKVFQVAPKWDILSGGYRQWFQQTIWTVPTEAWDVEAIVGNCVLFPVAAIRECGLMDERRLPQFGDSEYTPRMRKRGWRLLVDPAARVFCQPNDVPKGLRNRGLRAVIDSLFLNPHSAYSMRKRLYGNMLGGPNKCAGLIATLIFVLRWILGRNLEGAYGAAVKEPALSSIYGRSVSEQPSSRT